MLRDVDTLPWKMAGEVSRIAVASRFSGVPGVKTKQDVTWAVNSIDRPVDARMAAQVNILNVKSWVMAPYVFRTIMMDIIATINADIGDCNKSSADTNITQTVIPRIFHRNSLRPIIVPQYPC